MNKIYKLVWSKTKNMYVAVCEFARSHSKAPKSGVISRVAVAGVLATVLNFGIVFPVNVEAASITVGGGNINISNFTYGEDGDGYTHATGILSGTIKLDDTSFKQAVLDAVGSSGGSDGITAVNAGNGINVTTNGTTATVSAKAGNGIAVGAGGIAVKAGTNVTVDANGVSVTGNGTVASGNAGLINGGKLYSEVRPSGNGNYVMC